MEIDGETLAFDTAPVIQDGRTLVPFSAIAEGLGVIVQYDPSSKKVAAKKGNISVSFVLGKNKISINGQEQKLDVATTIVNGRVMLPACVFAEALGASVQWQDGTVLISTSSISAEQGQMNAFVKPQSPSALLALSAGVLGQGIQLQLQRERYCVVFSGRREGARGFAHQYGGSLFQAAVKLF